MEGCLAEMELANDHLQKIAEEMIVKLLDEGRTATREKAAERVRMKLAPQQKTLTTIPAVVRAAKKNGSAVALLKGGPARSAKISKAKGKELKEATYYPPPPDDPMGVEVDEDARED